MKYLLLILMNAFLALNVFAEEAHHHHNETTSLSLNNGKKWRVDSTMTKTMKTIENKFHETEKRIKVKTITHIDYISLSDLLVSSTETIIKSCKLEPKADETFHSAVLAPMLEAAEKLKIHDQQKSGLEKVRHALTLYFRYFENI